MWLTGQEETGEGDDVQLTHRYIIVVHKEVEQVDGQVTCRRAKLVSVTENSEQVSKVPPHPDLWRLGLVRWQLQLLRRKGWCGFYVTVYIIFGSWRVAKNITEFSKNALNLSKATVNIFIMLQKISERSIEQIIPKCITVYTEILETQL